MRGLSADCVNLLHRMLAVNPDQRPSAEEALQHPWFKQDKEIISDLIAFNEALCINSIAYLKAVGQGAA